MTITATKLVAAGIPFEEDHNIEIPDGQGAWLFPFVPDGHSVLPIMRIVDGWKVTDYVKPSWEDDEPDTPHYCGYPDTGVAFTMSHATALALAAT